MLYEIKLITRSQNGSLAEKPAEFFQLFEEWDCRIQIECLKITGIRILLTIQVEIEKNNRNFSEERFHSFFIHQISSFLAGHILQEWEPYFVRKYVQQNIKNISQKVQETLIKKSLYFLYYGEEENQRHELVYDERCRRLSDDIEEILCDFDLHDMNLNIEGWLRFRMKYFIREIKTAVQCSCKSWENMQEYEMFVEGLRDFVHEQAESGETLNFLFYPQGGFCLWDEYGQHLYETDMREQGLDLRPQEELLFSFLLNAAPEKIIWHRGQENWGERSAVLKVLKDVFEEHLEICTDCCLCRSIQWIQK